MCLRSCRLHYFFLILLFSSQANAIYFYAAGPIDGEWIFIPSETPNTAFTLSDQICEDFGVAMVDDPPNTTYTGSNVLQGSDNQCELFWYWGAEPPPVGPEGYLVMNLLKAQCPAAQEPVFDSSGNYTCVSNSICGDFPQFFEANAGIPYIEGYFEKGLTNNDNPVTADQVCVNTGDRECQMQVDVLDTIYQYSDGGSIQGYNVRLTPSTLECLDTPAYSISQWEELRDQPTAAYCDDPANFGDIECASTGGTITAGGEPNPEVTNDEVIPNENPEQNVDDPSDTDPSTIANSDDRNREILSETQESNDLSRETNNRLENLQSQISETNDLLAGLSNKIGNHEGDNKSVGGVGDCSVNPTCSGDPIQCAIYLEVRAARCAEQGTDGDGDYLAAIESEMPTETVNEFLQGEEFDVASTFDDSAIYSASCPAPYHVSVFGSTIAIPLGAVCTLAGYLNPFILLLSYLSAARILYRSF